MTDGVFCGNRNLSEKSKAIWWTLYRSGDDVEQGVLKSFVNELKKK